MQGSLPVLRVQSPSIVSGIGVLSQPPLYCDELGWICKHVGPRPIAVPASECCSRHHALEAR